MCGRLLRSSFDRTVCDCRACAISCEYLPGALAPEDVSAIGEHLGYADADAFAHENLLVSDGAVVALPDGRRVSLPTLVPATRDDGSCRFLVDGRCSIHAVAPFGCSHLDAHMSEEEAGRRSHALCVALLDDQQHDGVYTRLTSLLKSRGRIAPPLNDRRARLQSALRQDGGEGA